MCFVTVAKVIYLLATFRWDFTCGEPFNNQFVVRINGGPVIAQKVATEHGLNFVGQVFEGEITVFYKRYLFV